MSDLINEHLRNAKIKVLKSKLEESSDYQFDINSLKKSLNQFSLTSAEEVAFNKGLKSNPDKIISDLELWLEKHINTKDEKHSSMLISLQKQIFEKYDLLSEYIKGISSNPDFNFSKVVNETANNISLLHWSFLPVYDAQFISNRGILPEESIEEFYNHYHAIEDFIKYIQKPDLWKVTGADNLNQKMSFPIYTNRWGHDDNYYVSRTKEGWHFEFLAHSCKCKKDGTVSTEDDGLYDILDNDGVFYPLEGIKYALSILWTEADETDMSVKQLDKRFKEIGRWISKVNETNYQNQPSWVGYY